VNLSNQSSSRIKIVLVGALPVNTAEVKGGVEAVIVNLLNSFRGLADVSVTHLAFSKEVRDERTMELSENVRIRFIPFLNPLELVDYVINGKNLNRIIREERPDIIHIQEITPHLLRFLAFPKQRLVVTQHGIMAEELKYASGISQRLKCLFKVAVEKYAFPKFRNVIFISQYNRRLYQGVPSHETQIFNPVNPIFFEKVTSSMSKKNNLLYVGVLSRRKNIKLVVEALHNLNQQGYHFELNVAGGFKEAAYEEEVMSAVDEFGLKDRIHFHGWVSQERIRELYEICPIFILPSMQETLPVSIAEAMAQGKIVVASDVGAIREMFSDRKSGFLFKRNDKNDLVQTLAEVFNHQQSDRIGETARTEAIEKFHPQKIALKTINFYRQVVAADTRDKGGNRL
jgi:glycosyltransferase involved in cell wall biosynthesis